MLRVLLGSGSLEVMGDFDQNISGELWGQMDRWWRQEDWRSILSLWKWGRHMQGEALLLVAGTQDCLPLAPCAVRTRCFPGQDRSRPPDDSRRGGWL